MNTNARINGLVKGWASAVVLAVGLWQAGPASADPIRFSTSGTFNLPTGPIALAGVTNASPGDCIQIGALPVDGVKGPLGVAPFHVQFTFNHDLPPIDVWATAPSLGYSADAPTPASVSTSASTAQLGLYPQIFQNLFAHPDWLHTMAFRGSDPTMEVAFWVHPDLGGVVTPVPEPSSVVVVVLGCAGLCWRTRRAARNRRSR